MPYTASSNPFANAGTSMFGQESSSGGLGSVLGAYLANQAGLIDLNDPDQKNAVQKNGVLGTIANNKLFSTPAGSVPPMPQIGAGGFGANANYSLDPSSAPVIPPSYVAPPSYVNPQASRDTLIPQTGGNPNAANNQSDQYSNPQSDKSSGGFGDMMKTFALLFGA